MKLSIGHLIGLGQPSGKSAEEGDEPKDEKKTPEEGEDGANKSEGGKSEDGKSGGEKKEETTDEAKEAGATAPQPAAADTQAACAAARAEERARIAAILSAPEAAGRGDLALHFACSSDLSVEAAKKALAAAPRAAKGQLAALMGAHAPNPKIGPAGDPSASEADAGWGRAVAQFCAQHGLEPAKA